MPLDVNTAAEVARRHGLTLQDAQALSVLADDEDSANALAERFAPPSGTSDAEADAIADRIRRRGGGAR